MGSIISTVSISPEGFLPSILLLVVVIVTVVIVAVILVVVVVVAIDGVVIFVMIIGVEVVVMIIGVVVVVGVSFIIKLSLMIIGLEAITFPSILRGNSLLKASWSFSESDTIVGHKLMLPEQQQHNHQLATGWQHDSWLVLQIDRHEEYEMSDPIGGLVFLGGDVVDLTGDEDPTDEDRDTGMGDLTGVSVSLGGEFFSKENKSRESNIGGSDDTGDRGEIASEVKRYLVKSLEELGEMFPDEAGK
uniref:Uncharacterized protein n=1 Tax=Tanacetum cinerariifolium TaxID=118510 RepID=A0A6L2KLA0_TANCI|nr:hypothetical protein [Tanacetum cinerariifolium]